MATQPQKLTDELKRTTIVLDPGTEQNLKITHEYFKDILGANVSVSCIVRNAINRYKQWIDHQFAVTLVDSPSKSLDEFDAFVAEEKRFTAMVNMLNPKRM